MDKLVLQPQPSVMTSAQHFARVPTAEIERSTFDRSHSVKTTFDAGWLIPIFVDEMLPGDTFRMGMNAQIRILSPLGKPIMDNIYLDSFFFFVPNRLIWTNWDKFLGAKENPGDTTVYTLPQFSTAESFTPAVGSAWDYMGLPMIANAHRINGGLTDMPFRAMALIRKEWFRDQNLQDTVTVPTGDGPTAPDQPYTQLFRRGKRKDYFTSCLPWPQKGDPITIPVGGHAPVVFPTGINLVHFYNSGGSSWDGGTLQMQDPGGTGNYEFRTTGGTVSGAPVWADARGEVPTPSDAYADVGASVAPTINQLRTAFQLQRLLERDARSGTRLPELIYAHFGVVNPDFRLQRPELLGTGETMVSAVPIAQTSVGSGNLGALAAQGVAQVTNGHGFSYSATEHGYVLGFVSARADLVYQYSCNRMWSRVSRYDFYWPALAHLGEQVVYNHEIYPQLNADDAEPWGYQERYGEYRYKPSLVTGLMRSSAAGSIDIWHLAIEHNALPVLGDDYIQDDPPIDRVIAVPSEPHFVGEFFFSLTCARPMPVYSVPGMIDHF